MNFIQKKYDDYIQLRKEEIELKKNILYTYDRYKNNYNSIMNVKKLKFDYYKFNDDIDKDKGKDKEKEKDKEENKNKKNLNKLRNFKKIINELILYEESQCLQHDKEEEINNQININNNNLNNEINKEKEKEKDKIYCYKENIILKNSKFEVVNKINKKNVEAEYIITLKDNKLLIAYNNRKIVIYEKNKLNNNLEKLCSVSLAITKKNAIRTIKNYKGIYQLKNEDLLISMTGLSNFILSVDYKTKTFKVVQEFNISKTLRLNNPLFSNIPEDYNNYEDVIPLANNNVMNNNNIITNVNNNNRIINNNNIIITNNQINNNINNINEINNNNMDNIDNINSNLNINELIRQNNRNLPLVFKISDLNRRNNANVIINNNNNLNNNINNNQNPNNNDNNINNNNNNIQQRFIPHIRLMPHGIVQRINNRIGIPANHPLPVNIANRVINNRFIRRRNLSTIIALPNDDLLALSSKECWVLRKNPIKYVIYKDGIINSTNILMIKKAISISENEFVVEMTISQKRTGPPYHHIATKISRKNNLLYIFFNLNYEEICRRNLNLEETNIISDNEYIYINDLHTLALMTKKNKEVINIIEINSLGPIFPNKLNKSFIIQEKENNAIVEYRIINNEVIRGEQLIGNEKIKLLAVLDDDFNTLVIQFRNESLLFLQ